MRLNEVDSIYQLGIGIVIVGVIILVLAVVLIALTKMRKGKVKAAGAVFLGPVPIVFGTDKKTVKTVIVLSVVLTAMLIVLSVVWYFLLK